MPNSVVWARTAPEVTRPGGAPSAGRVAEGRAASGGTGFAALVGGPKEDAPVQPRNPGYATPTGEADAEAEGPRGERDDSDEGEAGPGGMLPGPVLPLRAVPEPAPISDEIGEGLEDAGAGLPASRESRSMGVLSGTADAAAAPIPWPLQAGPGEGGRTPDGEAPAPRRRNSVGAVGPERQDAGWPGPSGGVAFAASAAPKGEAPAGPALAAEGQPGSEGGQLDPGAGHEVRPSKEPAEAVAGDALAAGVSSILGAGPATAGLAGQGRSGLRAVDMPATSRTDRAVDRNGDAVIRSSVTWSSIGTDGEAAPDASRTEGRDAEPALPAPEQAGTDSDGLRGIRGDPAQARQVLRPDPRTGAAGPGRARTAGHLAAAPPRGRDDLRSKPARMEADAPTVLPAGSAVGVAVPAPTADSPQEARRIARQVADHPALRAGGSAEVRLAPEELGQLRLSVETGDTGLRVVIEAARPETADLLRRHVEVLRQELRQEGLGSVSVSIGGGEGRRGGDSAPDRGSGGGWATPAAWTAGAEPAPGPAAIPTALPRTSGASGRIDLRF